MYAWKRSEQIQGINLWANFSVALLYVHPIIIRLILLLFISQAKKGNFFSLKLGIFFLGTFYTVFHIYICIYIHRCWTAGNLKCRHSARCAWYCSCYVNVYHGIQNKGKPCSVWTCSAVYLSMKKEVKNQWSAYISIYNDDDILTY